MRIKLEDELIDCEKRMDRENKKKIGLVSCYYINNYGSILQSYALQRILDKQGIPNETINVSGFLKSIRLKQYKYIVKSGLSSGLLFDRMGKARKLLFKKLINNTYTRSIKVRENLMRKFVYENIRTSEECTSLDVLSQRCKEWYSSVLLGSDQLWLPANIAAGYYTLDFVPIEIKKISYATSFGVAELPHNINKLAENFLMRMDYISVREASGQRIVETLIKQKVPIVCDPTFLISGDEWMDIQKKDPVVEGGYIFCYFIGKNPEGRMFAKQLKEYTGLKIVALIHLDYFMKIDMGYADETPFNIGPAEFVSMIRNADFICTDSFHCTLFSILYNKLFFVFRRYNRDSGISTNSRLDTLMKGCSVVDRMMDGEKTVRECISMDIDYSLVNKRADTIRRESLGYLSSALGCVIKTD